MANIAAPATQITGEITRAVGKLSRHVNFTGTLTFGVLCVGLSVSGLLPISTLVGIWPGVNIIGALGIAFGLSLLHAYTYSMIGSAAPFSGADYVLASRTINPQLAFISSMIFVLASALVAGSFIALIPQAVLPTFFRSVGIVFENPEWLALASLISAPQGVVILGTIGVVIAFAATMVTPRTLLRIFEVGFLIGLVAWLILYAQLAFSAPDAFPTAWDRFMGAGSYDARIGLAQSLGMVSQGSSSQLIYVALLVGFWVFFGSFVPTYFASEVKEPGKNILLGSWTSLALSAVILTGVILLLQRLIPAEWLSAESFLHQSGYEGLTMPWVTFYAAVLQPNLLLILLVAVAWVLTLINMVQTYLFFTSRIVLSWAEDGLLPHVAKYVHPTRKSPLLALLIVSIMVEVGLVDAAQSGFLSSQLNFVFFVLVSQILPVLAMVLFPFLKRDWYKRTPRIVQAQIGPIPVISILGLATLVYLVWALIAASMSPSVEIIRPGSTGILVVLFFVGLIWFSLRRTYLESRGRAVEWKVNQMPAEEVEEE